MLVVAFVGALLLIELNRHALLPGVLQAVVPTNHFRAIDFAFSLLLVIEVLALVWTLAESFANSVGKQFELFALILLRKAFMEFGGFGEPIVWEEISESVLHVLADLSGALLVFVILGFYYRIQEHAPITDDRGEERLFISAKKIVALLLLAIFVGLGGWHLTGLATGRPMLPFFETFFTVLIFADVLMVLISLRCSSRFDVVFRNSGFAAATVMIRLALTAPPYVNVLLGLGASLFALGLTFSYNHFAPVLRERNAGARGEETGGPPPAPLIDPTRGRRSPDPTGPPSSGSPPS